MTLTLELGPAMEVRLMQKAQREGLSADECAIRLLEVGLQQADQPASTIALLQSWIDEGNEAEQRETGEYLVRALDEDRPSLRRLYPLPADHDDGNAPGRRVLGHRAAAGPTDSG